MEPLPPIPVPLKQRWREFRVAYLPPLTFVLLVGVIVWMWAQYVHPPDVVGQVEPVRATIVTVQAGTLQALKVDRFQPVTIGQELAVVAVIEPDQLAAELTALAADLRLTKARMDLDKTRNLDAYSRLRLELLDEQVALDLARIRSQQAETEFQRVSLLYEKQLIPKGVQSAPSGMGTRNEFGYDVALRDRDALRAEVESGTRKVAQLEQAVKQMEATGTIGTPATDPIVEAAIQAQQTRLELLDRPVVLRSPIDGFVSLVNHRPGEKVPAGQPILVVSARKSDRIIGWVRQPVSVRPAVGDRVTVRRSFLSHEAIQCPVIEVGTQLEPIDPVALPPNTPANRVEVGLPFLVQAPAGLDLIPGEAVELTIEARPRTWSAN